MQLSIQFDCGSIKALPLITSILISAVSIALTGCNDTKADQGVNKANVLAVPEKPDLPQRLDVLQEVDGEKLSKCQGEVSTWTDCVGRSKRGDGRSLVYFQGKFKKGKLVKGAFIDAAHGLVTLGTFKPESGVDGVGEKNYNDGTVFIGHFALDKENGVGINYFADGSYAFGNYKDGNRDGIHYQMKADGRPNLRLIYVLGDKTGMEVATDEGFVSNEVLGQKLEIACRSYVTRLFSGSAKDAYGVEIRRSVPPQSITVYGFQDDGFFNGHRYATFAGYYDTVGGDNINRRDNIPFSYCVFDNGFNVISLDTKQRDLVGR